MGEAMDHRHPTRREFLSSTGGLAGAGWLAFHLPMLAALASCAGDAAVEQAPLRVLSTEAAAAMRALAARIIPSDGDMPGAEEAGAVWFIDAVLQGPFADLTGPVLAGLAVLDERARARALSSFARATPREQDAIITEVEDTEFFSMARLLTAAGVFSHPRYGGNRDLAGFAILGVEHASAYQPPFGWYDAAHARGTLS